MKTTIYEANKPLNIKFKELWHFRNLLLSFVVRDVKTKYAQTVFGVIWAFIQPVVGLLLFTFFFGKLLNVGTIGTPHYPLFLFTGMMGWYYFSFISAHSGVSLFESAHLIKKMNFPLIILPITKAFVGLFEFAIWFIILIALLLIYQQPITYKILLLPFFVLLNMFTGLVIGIWLAALTYRLRDLLHIIPYLVGFSIFVTPVFYPGTLIPQNLHFFIYANPIAGVIEGYRWCLLDTASYRSEYFIGFGIVLIFLFFAVAYFNRISRKVVDYI